MRLHRFLWPVWVAGAGAQYVGWTENQVNTSICAWYQPRAALIRDTVYLDGGNVYWSPGLEDGRYGLPIDWGNYRGIIFTYNLSNPFDAETNVTKLLIDNTVSKALDGKGNANGAAPNFVDGAMLYNDAEFFMYAGELFRNEDIYRNPEEDYVIGYQAYQYGADKPAWAPGFDTKPLPDEVSRYIAYGAGVNAPSENKAWYFSGMVSPTRGDIWNNPDSERVHVAEDVSNTLIELDMGEQWQEEWENSTLPRTVKGRANAEAVWVPVGEQGILVILGGVTHPQWVGQYGRSEDEEASEEESPEFMRTIDIYDIANDEWYKQETEDGPGARTRGCAVVAAASDHSSFNIYYYGGFDGLNIIDPFYDDVWVLSLPSFTWTRLNDGTDSHARAGHKCFMPYPDQMMVFGGDRAQPGRGKSCLENGPIVLFNLSSGEWMDSYHPEEHSDYSVPDKVVQAIGGDGAGGATLTTPVPSGWATDALEDLFSSSYDTDKITTWGPYPAVETDEGRPEVPSDNDEDGGGGGGGLPKWVAPVLGVVLGLMVVTASLVIFCLWRRRKILKSGSTDYGTEDPGHRILSWIKGQPTEKAPTVTTSEDAPMSPDMAGAKAVAHVSSPTSPRHDHHEMAGTPIAELDDTSPPVELSDTGLSPSDIIQKHSRLASEKTRSMSYSSFSGSTQDYQSTISRGSFPAASDGRPDSPSLPNAELGRIPGQMQSLSETLAAATGNGDGSAPPTGRGTTEQVDIPVSPPTAGDSPGEDYLSAREGRVSPLRKSAFHEDEEDLGKKQ